MTKQFGTSIHFHNNIYDSNIDKAHSQLNTSPDDIISIKLRPMGTNDKDEYENATFDWHYYADFRIYIDQHQSEFAKIENSSKSILITTMNGKEVLYEEHETVPEFIFDIAVKTIEFYQVLQD